MIFLYFIFCAFFSSSSSISLFFINGETSAVRSPQMKKRIIDFILENENIKTRNSFSNFYYYYYSTAASSVVNGFAVSSCHENGSLNLHLRANYENYFFNYFFPSLCQVKVFTSYGSIFVECFPEDPEENVSLRQQLILKIKNV